MDPRWKPIAEEHDPTQASAFAIAFKPPSNYIFFTPADKEELIKNYPEVTHYRIICEAPC